MPSQFDKEKAKKNAALILERIRNDTNLELLSEYRRLFKKEIPLFRRSWASAYLLMLFDQKSPGRGEGRFRGEGRLPQGRGVSSPGRETEPQRYPLPEAESKRLFISVGRNRRVFPREILGLINSKTAIPKEDIGSIRILDNYSFVQVRDTVAGKIIEALDGITFRGRILAVNYAKSRKDEAGGQDEPETDEEAEEAGDTYDENRSVLTGPEEYPAVYGDDVSEPEDAALDQEQNHPKEENV
ncbi:MAG: DbpA RNA binding domain-containing protein [Treponema sp.]|jgi:hypothetical protein|nr:DbpA RNA binding domain-containing protein [Treponema sp.]